MTLFFKRLGALTAATLLSLALASAAANEIYVKNRLFKGSVSSVEGQLWVDLPTFAKALGANLASNEQGGHLLSLEKLGPDGAKGVPANTVMVAGSPVETRTNGAAIEVPLEKTAKLLNAKVIANKSLGTIDVNLGGPVQAYVPAPDPAVVAAEAQKSKDKAKATAAKTLRVQGKITLPGANQVGLFEGGSSSVPYKTGKVDAKGNYTIDIDLEKDLHNGMTDMRFFLDGDFGSCHGRCNFIMVNPQTKVAVLEPYGSDQSVQAKDGVLLYTEAGE